MDKAKNNKFNRIKVLVLIFGTLASFCCTKTLAVDYKETGNVVSETLNKNKLDSLWEAIDSFKIEGENYESVTKTADKAYPSLSETACANIREYKVKNAQSLKNFLNYIKNHAEIKEFMENYRSWKVYDIGKGNYLLYTKHKKGLNFLAFVEEKNFYEKNRFFKGPLCPSSFIRIPYVTNDSFKKSLEKFHFLEHVLVSAPCIKYRMSPFNFFYDYCLGAYTTDPCDARGYIDIISEDAVGSSNFLKCLYNELEKPSFLNKEKGDSLIKAEKSGVIIESAIRKQCDIENLKYISSAGEALDDRLNNKDYSDVDNYNNSFVGVVNHLKKDDLVRAFEDFVHPSNCIVSVRLSRENLVELVNCLKYTDTFCRNYKDKDVKFLKTRKDRDDSLYKYQYNKKYADEHGIYIKGRLDASKYASLFIDGDDKNKEKTKNPVMFNCNLTYYIRFKDLGINNVTPAIFELFNLRRDAIETVLGKDKIKELSTFEKFCLLGVCDEGIFFEALGNDESAFNKDCVGRNVRNVLEAFVEKVKTLSDYDFFKLNRFSDEKDEIFNEQRNNPSYYGYVQGDVSRLIASSYDGDVLHIEDVLDVEDGVLQTSNSRIRENILKNRRYIKNLRIPANYSEVYVATRKPGTVAPYVGPVPEENKNHHYYRTIKYPNYVLPVKFNNCKDDEVLDHVVEHIFLNFYNIILSQKGYSYDGFRRCNEDGSYCYVIAKSSNKNIICEEFAQTIEFLKNKFNDGTIKKYYEQFLKNGTGDLVNSNDGLPIDNFIELTKRKFINKIKNSLKDYKKSYFENEEQYKNITSFKDIDNLPEKVMDCVFYRVPVLDFSFNIIPSYCKGYEDFVKKCRVFLKNSTERKKALAKSYVDVMEGKASKERLKDYYKSIYILFKNYIYKNSQKLIVEICNIMLEAIKYYENLDVKKVKELLKDVEVLKWDEVNKKDKNSENKN